jgi:ABC-type glycerol-3-phosphate transport system substrate-binding protein
LAKRRGEAKAATEEGMKILSTILLTGVALAGGVAAAMAADKTEISVSRFFGACEADYGSVTDVAKANGECGIITALINKFNADSPDTHVKVDIVEWPGYDQLTARIRSGEPPTISVMHEAVISDYSSHGLLSTHRTLPKPPRPASPRTGRSMRCRSTRILGSGTSI